MPSLNLLADIGGTNARFALSDGARLFAIQTLPTADYPTLQDAIRAYLQAQSETVAQAAIAIANPVTGDHIQMTNHHWQFSIAAMQHELRLEKLRVINDFTAQALAIPRLTATEKRPVRAGEAVAGTPIAVLGPGTGLGVSGLIPNGDRWIALASEGGHVSFAPRDDAELAIWQYARIQYGHVSAERLITRHGAQAMQYGSGQGWEVLRERITEVMTYDGIVGADPDNVVVTTEATAVTSTPATMTRKPAIFASCPTTGLITGLTRPNMARNAILRVPMRLMTE